MAITITTYQPEQREREPGLREETLCEIIKKRHTYPHEAVAMATEILELRAKLNVASVTVEPPREKFNFSSWHKDNAREAAEHLAEFPWDKTAQGYEWWDNVWEALRELASS